MTCPTGLRFAQNEYIHYNLDTIYDSTASRSRLMVLLTVTDDPVLHEEANSQLTMHRPRQGTGI